ncbi:ABC-type lipoprotein export system ATPase subunit/ABC-type lipoprotein release transport system permease subunit [Peribacillus deserti]|uniref:ABC-type lipoprotein export system ATPase subunit/ABC-type lipoprotein release transport system permease subunit n=1 Tax=Peribacillus deserti TaxID=673318 RepID=A0ABS2QEM4_9BACI|nr:ABC transporter ATP-binding protein/permease [Peribacillus deserti]MBM7690761.1 ABC-type lipoprotein export system ATPase subunit/ABC-type lipoprotein release transport system permease subunit [Peribacillus deserti]
MISLRNIKKNYELGSQEIPVLKDINVSLYPGQLSYLIGESGCGKSTLLNIIGGIDTYSEGTYLFGQQNVSTFTEKDWAFFRRKRIGFVFQNFNLISHLTAIENIEMSMILEGKSKSERLKKAMELLQLVGMSDRAHHLPNQLSGGQKQRISIARALANDPDVILADEPTGALDSENSIQVMEILRDIAHQGKIVLVVTHSQELTNYADRIIKMRDGEVINQMDYTNEQLIKPSSHMTEKKRKRNKINWNMTMKLAVRNIRNKKWRSILTAAGASIGVFGIVLMGALGNGVNEKISSSVDTETANASIGVGKDEAELLSKKDLHTLQALKDVEEVYPYNPFQASIKAGNNKKTSGTAESLVPEAHKHIYGKQYLKDGSYPDSKKSEIVLPARMAAEIFGSSKSAIGKKVTITAQLMSLDDLYPTQQVEATVSGILKNESIPLLDTVGLSYNISQKLIQDNDQINGKSLAYTVIPTSDEKVDSLKKAIIAKGFNAQTEGESGNELMGYVSMATVGLGMLSAISLIVSSLMIGIVLYVSVVERTREIGILKAIGAFRSDIRKIFVTEGVVIGLLGGLLGAGGAYVIGKAANWIITDLLSKPDLGIFLFNPFQLIAIIAFSALLGILASFFPAYKASKQTALEALRYE